MRPNDVCRKETVERYLIYRAYHCYLHGQPLPVTLFSELIEAGFNPEDIETAFHEGAVPPFELVDELEQVGIDEDERLYITVRGEHIYLEDIEPEELEDLLRQIEEDEEDE